MMKNKIPKTKLLIEQPFSTFFKKSNFDRQLNPILINNLIKRLSSTIISKTCVWTVVVVKYPLLIRGKGKVITIVLYKKCEFYSLN